MSKLRGEDPSHPFSIAPQAFPEGLFMSMPVLGRPSLKNLTRHWLTGHALGARQGDVKWAEAVLLPGR